MDMQEQYVGVEPILLAEPVDSWSTLQIMVRGDAPLCIGEQVSDSCTAAKMTGMRSISLAPGESLYGWSTRDVFVRYERMCH